MLRNSTLSDQLADARAAYAAKRPKSLAAHEAASNYMPGGNTRTVLYHGPFPIRAASGEGSTIEDLDGHRYLNMLGEYTAGVFGHSHPAIRRAIDGALDHGVNLSAHNGYEPELARLVVERFPAMRKVRFTNSGTEANMMAIATARATTGREKVMVFRGGYHGAVLYFGGDGLPINAPFPYVVARYNDPASVSAVIDEHGDELACIIIEPMLGSSGCIPAHDGFLAHVRAEADRCGALLIFDEVMTSRFGPNGASALFGVTPDLVTLGKWVGGGMSFGAFGGSDALMALYDPTQPNALPHAGTFNNNVVSMSAGIAALSEAFTSADAERLHARGEALSARIASIFERHGGTFQVTGVGSLMNIHAVRDPIVRPEDLAGSNEAAKELLFLDLLDAGIYIARRGFIALSVAATDDDLDTFTRRLDDCLAARETVYRTTH
ncbi:MAG: aminotransferase class III-fold pyridoxal phosphate-dependent enzyme [Devosiaceae bacterium]|nr:aminotransferase class III-fold pyridoxal phosphate-dependent enzyme [Devosiaceae bacterium MH13]